MTQNSVSPVVKSRISSSAGRMMRVENRSLALTGTMSSFAYLTTRAVASVAAFALKETTPKRMTVRIGRKRPGLLLQKIRFIEMLLLRWILGLLETPVTVGKNPRERLHRQNERREGCAQEERQK